MHPRSDFTYVSLADFSFAVWIQDFFLWGGESARLAPSSLFASIYVLTYLRSRSALSRVSLPFLSRSLISLISIYVDPARLLCESPIPECFPDEYSSGFPTRRAKVREERVWTDPPPLKMVGSGCMLGYRGNTGRQMCKKGEQDSLNKTKVGEECESPQHIQLRARVLIAINPS